MGKERVGTSCQQPGSGAREGGHTNPSRAFLPLGTSTTFSPATRFFWTYISGWGREGGASRERRPVSPWGQGEKKEH